MYAVVVLEKQGLGTTNPLLKQITQQERRPQRFIKASQFRELGKSSDICIENVSALTYSIVRVRFLADILRVSMLRGCTVLLRV